MAGLKTTERNTWRVWRRNTITRPLFKWYKSVLPDMSETERDALEAGTVWWDAEMFSGRPNWTKLHSVPVSRLTAEEQAFLEGPTNTLCGMLDDWRINSEWRDLPPDVWDYIKAQRFFGMIIPQEHGGLGFSAFAHSEIVSRIATRSIAAAVTVMVPNSLGPAELLLHYGTDAQKSHYLPRLARGDEIPCFALTGPFAGSDAASIPDVGIVCKGQHEGREVLGLRATWEKRYITLGPVATVMGLALNVRDPDKVLGEVEDLGITVALVPTRTPGIEIGRRHVPAHQAFMNGPNSGTDVFIPFDWVIGGEAQVGKGWRMLMESLAAGRGISLPSLAAGGTKFCAHTTGAYARVRKQFKLPIGKFEGVREPLARIAGFAYMTESMRRFVAAGIDAGEKPSVLSAIAKLHTTSMMRDAVNDAMDIHGGKGICDGPSNYLSNVYHALPVSITVEGANILTRSLIVFGQGAIRCHPYLYREMRAVREPDPDTALNTFDEVLWQHVGHQVTTMIRSLWHNLTGAIGAHAPPGVGKARPIYRTLMRSSVNFAAAAEAAMMVYGGDLKKRESQSARLGDALSYLCMISACLKRFRDDGQPPEDLPVLQWCADYGFKCIDDALAGVLENLKFRPLAWLLYPFVRPVLGRPRWPRDQLTGRVADLLQSPSATRARLTAGIYIGDKDQPVAKLDAALTAVIAADDIRARIKAGAHPTAEEQAFIARSEALIREVIMVDDFAKEALSKT
jgi:acyl-CoA dehydrogenase